MLSLLQKNMIKKALLVFFLFYATQSLFSQTGCVNGNCKNGIGTWQYRNGNKYVGEFKHYMLNGQGTFTWASGDWKNCKYVGEWKNNKISGSGTFTYANGDLYVGEFNNNKLCGKGVFTYANGDKYDGEWENNKFNGLGTFTKSSGQVIKGRWKKGDLQE